MAEVTVRLCRDGLHTPWGFRLQGGLEYNTPLRVQRIAIPGCAESLLIPGDMLVRIGNADASRLTHEDAVDLIASAGSTLHLTVARGSVVQRSAPLSNSRPPSRRSVSLEPFDLEEDESRIPQNYQLAGLMNQSVKNHRQPTQNNYSNQNTMYRTMPFFRPQPKPVKDITSYLPQPRKLLRRSGSGTSFRDAQLRNQMRDTLLRSDSVSSMGSGRSTPVSIFEFPAENPSAAAVGYWTPPVHQPNARLVHLQYNSPMNMYTPHNVADMVHMQTGQKLSWQRKPPVRFLDDIRDSPTYKLVQEIQTPLEDGRATPVSFEQSRTMKNINRYLNLRY